jgi:hypothetical protein
MDGSLSSVQPVYRTCLKLTKWNFAAFSVQYCLECGCRHCCGQSNLTALCDWHSKLLPCKSLLSALVWYCHLVISIGLLLPADQKPIPDQWSQFIMIFRCGHILGWLTTTQARQIFMYKLVFNKIYVNFPLLFLLTLILPNPRTPH